MRGAELRPKGMRTNWYKSPFEPKDEERPSGRVQWEREEAVRQVQFTVPTVLRRSLGGCADRGIGEVLIDEVVVQVARQVDDQSRLLRRLDDGMKRLNAERAGMVGCKRTTAPKATYSSIRVRISTACW